MSGTESRLESVNEKPFIIRAHHLRFYRQIYTDTSGDVNDRLSRMAEQLSINIMGMWRNGPPFDPDYGPDTIGSFATNTKFEKNYRQALQTFYQLPDDYPIEIVEGVPDTICQGCAIGKHCHRLSSAGRQDQTTIDLFLERAKFLNPPQTNSW